MNKKLNRIEDTLQAELHTYNEQSIRQTEVLKDACDSEHPTWS